VEVICDYCKVSYTYKGGIAHYKRSNKHYCSRPCHANGNHLKRGNQVHGMAKSTLNNKKNDIRYVMWCSASKRAKIKNIPFAILPTDIPEIPSLCPVLGIELKQSKDKYNLDASPSLDKIEPQKGYVLGNIRIISHKANKLKSNATVNELRLVLKDLEDLYENL
jgi:hypothetical protein